MAAARMWTSFWFVFLCYLNNKSVNSADGILCSDQYCRDYGFEVGCATPALSCAINNATHSGLTLPSPTVCNCCDFCLSFFLEGQSCSLGGPGDGITVGRCGAGLACVAEEEGNRCRRMESDCHSAQDEYDARHARGEVGFLEERPRCDDKGRFAPASCVSTQTCFCQTEQGERIFGEAEYRDSSTLQSMQCGCSRRNENIRRSIGAGVRLPVLGPRCSQDGGYNPVQCDERSCRCVNRLTGVVATAHHVDLDEQSIRELPCYDPSLDIYPELSAEEADPPFNYTSPCELEREEQMRRVLESEEDGYIVDFFTSAMECLPDGSYGRIRTELDGRKVCITETGEPIEDYHSNPGSADYDTMDCKCALTSRLLRSAERPACCRGGNFRTVQCRRGVCYCVDADGRQLGKETADVAQLPCHTQAWRTC